MKIYQKLIPITLSVFFVCLFSVKSSAENIGERSTVYTLSSIQSSDGMTQEDMTPEFLGWLEQNTKERIRHHASAYLKSIGSKNINIEIRASSVYVVADSHKLAVTRINAAGGSQVHIFGINGKEAIRVACVHGLPDPIPISYGKCAEKIYESFGVKINGK